MASTTDHALLALLDGQAVQMIVTVSKLLVQMVLPSGLSACASREQSEPFSGLDLATLGTARLVVLVTHRLQEKSVSVLLVLKEARGTLLAFVRRLWRVRSLGTKSSSSTLAAVIHARPALQLVKMETAPRLTVLLELPTGPSVSAVDRTLEP